MPWEYVADNAIWSAAGLAVGYVLGRTERSLWIRYRKKKK